MLRQARVPRTYLVRITDHGSAHDANVGDIPGMDRESARDDTVGNTTVTDRGSVNDATASDATGGDPRSDLDASGGPSGATVDSEAVRGPSGADPGAGTSLTTRRATVLSKDTSKFLIISNGITMSVSKPVVMEAASKMQLEVGDAIRVALSANTNEVCKIIDDR